MASFLLAGVEWVRVNGRALVIKREPICTVEEYIAGEIREELLTWAFFMSQHLQDIKPSAAMRHDSFERHKGALRQRRWGIK